MRSAHSVICGETSTRSQGHGRHALLGSHDVIGGRSIGSIHVWVLMLVRFQRVLLLAVIIVTCLVIGHIGAILVHPFIPR